MTAIIETSDSISRKIEALDIVVEARKAELGANAFAALNGDKAAITKTEQLNEEIKGFAADREALLAALVHALDREQNQRDLAALAERQAAWNEARTMRDRLLSNAKAYEKAVAEIDRLTSSMGEDNEAIRRLMRKACLSYSDSVVGRGNVFSILAGDIRGMGDKLHQPQTVRTMTRAWVILDEELADHV
ncbi:MAG: hypothetical protein ACOZAM_23750 [Pseudomonadota bacterium]